MTKLTNDKMTNDKMTNDQSTTYQSTIKPHWRNPDNLTRRHKEHKVYLCAFVSLCEEY